ncbi:hypothetical protein OH77DRAFT_1514872 [Trametes cingulata]|nr:hypothetical protein OH77DRAFT_1514872 [Trametes cingulata]
MPYAVLVCDNQHRTHHFTLIICGEKARIAGWDRSGVIFSKQFEYVQEPALLVKFPWKFPRLPAAQRGHHTAATRVPPNTPDYDLALERRERRVHQGPIWRPRVTEEKGRGTGGRFMADYFDDFTENARNREHHGGPTKYTQCWKERSRRLGRILSPL